MASRLALKYGLVPEEDRLPTSPDATVITQPTTGSKARTKGSLYLVVTSRVSSARARDACELVANSIRREYYYDESAGIAIVLEKAIRAANRQLHKSRGGPGVPEGSLGLAAAVVRGNELYVASCGDAESYLVRSARLLMPEHEPANGLPTSVDPLRVDVWRGEFAVGDSLVLAAHRVVEAVGTEELKNAVITLHPQSAVEHLHHLYVAAGGEGSDALIAIEASEATLARGEHRLVPIETPETPARHFGVPVPLGDQGGGVGSAVSDRAIAARDAVREGFSGMVGRVLELMPRRRTSYRRITPSTSKQESRRRAAMAVLAFIGVVTVLGIALWAWNPLRAETPIQQVASGEAALAAANEKAERVFGREDLLNTDPPEAIEQLREALGDLDRAATGDVDERAIGQLRAQVTQGLEDLYGTVEVTGTPFFGAPNGQSLSSLVSGPDEAAYVIAGDTVVRVDNATRASATIITAGEGPGQGIATPRLLARGGPDLLILDSRGALWRWRPSDTSGNGTLGPVRVAGSDVWDESVVDVEAFVTNAEQPDLYNLYVSHPTSSQIMRYEPTADGSGFSVPAPYFVGDDEDVSAFRQLYIDGDVYAVTSANLLRYFSGARTNFTLDEPPDNEDLRPGHDYALMAATGTRGVGLLVVWDQLHSRILVYDKSEGTRGEQFIAAPGAAPFADLRGMYLVDRGAARAPILVYARPEGIYQVDLAEEQEPTPTPSPSPSAQPSPSVRPTPTEPSPQPTERPRRTPRTTASP